MLELTARFIESPLMDARRLRGAFMSAHKRYQERVWEKPGVFRRDGRYWFRTPDGSVMPYKFPSPTEEEQWLQKQDKNARPPRPRRATPTP